MGEKSQSFHYAWLVLIGCCFLSAGGFALVFDVVGVYLDTVSESLDIDFGALTLWLGLESVAEFIIMPFAGRLFESKRIHVFITVGAILVALGTLGFAFCTVTWNFIVCGVLIGFGMPFIFGLPQTTLIGNWFGKKHQGKMLSIAMSFEGIFAMIWAPLFALFLQEFGWQTTYMINALFIAVMILPWSIFVLRRRPEDKGLLPYGVTDHEADLSGLEDEEDNEVGSKVATALRCPAFWFTLIGAALVTFGMGFSDYLPVFAGEKLVPALVSESSAELFGATMLSVYAAGSLVGTFVFGFFLDRLGLKPTFILFVGLFLAAFVVLGFMGDTKAMLLVGSFLLGTHNGLASVGFPLLVRRLFGGLHYSQLYSYISMVTTLLGGFTVSIVGYAFGALGTFEMTILVVGFAIAIVVAICTIVATQFVGRTIWDAELATDEAAAG